MTVDERYHAPLRKTSLKLQETYGIEPMDAPAGVDENPAGPDGISNAKRRKRKKFKRPIGIKDSYLLAIAVMCINSTVGPEVICPALLVFGAMPKLPLPGSLPGAVSQSERMKILNTDREKYVSLVAKMRLEQAEKAFVPRTPPASLKYGDKVLMYRDTTGRSDPRIFASRNENTILVQEPDGNVQPYGTSKVSELREGIYLPRPDLYGIDDDVDSHKKYYSAEENGAPAESMIDKDARIDPPQVSLQPTEENHIPLQVDVETEEPVQDSGSMGESIRVTPKRWMIYLHCMR